MKLGPCYRCYLSCIDFHDFVFITRMVVGHASLKYILPIWCFAEGKSVQEMVDEALRRIPNQNGLFCS